MGNERLFLHRKTEWNFFIQLGGRKNKSNLCNLIKMTRTIIGS